MIVESASGIIHLLEQSANLTALSTFLLTNPLRQARTTSHANTNAVGAGSCFYLTGVKCP